jgi:hypothetical protein
MRGPYEQKRQLGTGASTNHHAGSGTDSILPRPGDYTIEILADQVVGLQALANGLTDACASYRGLLSQALTYIHTLQGELNDLQRRYYALLDDRRAA